MEQLIHLLKRFDKTKMVVPLTAAYFFVAVIEIIAESNKDLSLITMTKPLLMPVMMAMYWSASKKHDLLFIFAIVAVWAANLFFISSLGEMIFFGTVCFLVYRLLVIVVVFRLSKFPGYLPVVLGSLPFLFLYLFVSNLTYKELGDRFWMFVIQGIFLIFFGGFCLGNYILKSNKSNTYLLISTILFTLAQFLIVLKIYYMALSILQPLTMLTFITGQYLLYLYLLLEEKKKRRYKSINALKEKL